MCKLEEHTTDRPQPLALVSADGLFGFPDGSGWHPLTYITANKYTVARLDGAWFHWRKRGAPSGDGATGQPTTQRLTAMAA